MGHSGDATSRSGSNTAGCPAAGAWQPFGALATWILKLGEGPQSVYAKFTIKVWEFR